MARTRRRWGRDALVAGYESVCVVRPRPHRAGDLREGERGAALSRPRAGAAESGTQRDGARAAARRQLGQGDAGSWLEPSGFGALVSEVPTRSQLSQRVVKAGGTVLGGCRRAPAGSTNGAARPISASVPEAAPPEVFRRSTPLGWSCPRPRRERLRCTSRITGAPSVISSRRYCRQLMTVQMHHSLRTWRRVAGPICLDNLATHPRSATGSRCL